MFFRGDGACEIIVRALFRTMSPASRLALALVAAATAWQVAADCPVDSFDVLKPAVSPRLPRKSGLLIRFVTWI